VRLSDLNSRVVPFIAADVADTGGAPWGMDMAGAACPALARGTALLLHTECSRVFVRPHSMHCRDLLTPSVHSKFDEAQSALGMGEARSWWCPICVHVVARFGCSAWVPATAGS
jgi:hypothetical protein